MDYETILFIFWKNFNSIVRSIFKKNSHFHDWIKVIKLNMIKFESIEFININFMRCFIPDLGQNINYEL
jgi:hypothetical protein